jgi:16S rRNA (uracil1498-N3)-methyltransferase
VHRFFVPAECIEGEAAAVTGAVARQLATVLRAGPGDRISLLDDSGSEYAVTLSTVNPKEVTGVVTGRTDDVGPPPGAITLYQALLKADRFEMVLQKCTELGVVTFVPVIAERSVARTGEKWATSRYPRWRRIITEASEQSGRRRLPALEAPMVLRAACDAATGVRLIPWEEERDTGMKAALREAGSGAMRAGGVSIFVGPEGGLTEEEVRYANSRGIVAVSLGTRVLRAETAAMAAVAAVRYELGELGG